MRQLEDVLEELTPTPDPEFVAEMERRMELGFPSGKRRRLMPRALRERLTPQRPRAVAAVAASALLAVAVAVPLLTDDSSSPGGRPAVGESAGGAVAPANGDQASPTGEAAPRGRPPTESQLSLEDSPVALPLPPAGDDIAPGVRNRQVERLAQVSLAADPAEFDRIARATFAVAARHGGFVLRSSFTEGDEGSGFFELRVPTERLQEALTALSRLATVRTRTESSADVTGAVVSLRDRLRTARAERDGLLRRLERANSDRAARSIRRRLELVGREIGRLRAQLSDLRERTSYAAVSVELVDAQDGASASEAGDAFDDAIGSLESVGVFLIRALGVLLPLALAGALVWLALARGRRRARERTLA